MSPPDSRLACQFAEIILSCLHREYPNKMSHVFAGDADVQPPREVSPVFYGCFDWHSAVHGHWSLIRLLRCFPDNEFEGRALSALERSFKGDAISREHHRISAADQRGFEMPYGMAWILQLVAELREASGGTDHNLARQAADWTVEFGGLEALARDRFEEWLQRLSHPIRSGEHSQSAFALGLVLDWAEVAGETRFRQLVADHARRLHGGDSAWPMSYEPSGHDFLSPGLAEADLMRRVLAGSDYANWLRRFLPALEEADDDWLRPAVSPDPSDGKFAHIDGLNLSRAWMLEGIAAALPETEPRRPLLTRCAARHRQRGLEAVTGHHYAGAHWLGSFAVYLVTGRGLAR